MWANDPKSSWQVKETRLWLHLCPLRPKTSWKPDSCCQTRVSVNRRPSHCWRCRSNMCPENSTANNHDFQMHCFEETTSCKACSMLLRFRQLSLSLSLPPSPSLLTLLSPWTTVSMLSCAGGYFSRVTAVHAAKWLRTRSVWAESPPVDDTQVSLVCVCSHSLKSVQEMFWLTVHHFSPLTADCVSIKKVKQQLCVVYFPWFFFCR